MSDWNTEEIRKLSRLREGFLTGSAGAEDYWIEDSDLDLYERTFAQRIGWKWDAVLGELSLRGWSPPVRKLVDWACGSGIAGRRVLEHWPAAFDHVLLTDRSHRARNFAQNRLREIRNDLLVQVAVPEAAACDGALVLVSHLLTELTDQELCAILLRIKRADAVIWVEAATSENARRLMEAVRDPLLAGGEWRAVAPCTHSMKCPLLQVQHERHWCHHFARVPSEVHQNPGWRNFSERVGVDLRVLPYTFVVLERVEAATESKALQEMPSSAGFSRVLGTPREFKGFLKVLSCAADGVTDWTLQKRDVPERFKALRKGSELPLYRFETEGERVVRADRLGDEA
jgi:ribosomal protein RSM22 (predicted rRNA methylase)